MMKRKTALLLAGVMALSVLGSVSVNAEEKEPVTISMLGSADDIQKPYMQRIISMWEESTGNKVDQQGVDLGTSEQVMLTKFTTGEIPDIMMHFGNSDLENYNVDENFYDFSDAEWVSDVMDNVLPQATYNGKVIGLPFWEASVSGCIYNKVIFEELGLSVPTTQDEFNAVCDKLLEAGITPIYSGAGDAWPFFLQFDLDPIFDSEEGNELLKKLNNNEIKFADIPEITSMCEWYKMAAEKGWFGETYMTDTFDYVSEVLGTGEAAMVFLFDTWFDTDYDNSYTYQNSDFGIMPVFRGTSEKGTFEGPNASLMLVNKNSENLETVLDFIEFASTPENYNAAFDGIDTAPVFKQETTNVVSDMYKESEAIIKEVGHASMTPKIIGYGNALSTAVQELVAGNITVEECIARMDEDRIATLESFQK